MNKDSSLTENTVLLLSFILENEEMIVKDLKKLYKGAVETAPLFKGQSHIEFKKGVREITKMFFKNLLLYSIKDISQEEILIILEEKEVINFLERLEQKALRSSYEYKNTLH